MDPSTPSIPFNSTTLSSTPIFDDVRDGTVKAELDPDQALYLEPLLSQNKKWGLLAVFSLALFIDTWSYASFFVFTGPISDDLGIVIAQQSWVIISYAVTFAAFLLFWGRVSDIFNAKSVFTYGFVALGTLNLIISFLPDLYSFFILRAISGIVGAALIPASYRLMVIVFEPEELGRAFTIYGLSGPIANMTGFIVAGLVEYIPYKGQMVAWRWFFRILAAMILPVAAGSFYWIPTPAPHKPITHIWKRLDLVGSLSMLSTIILIILAFTLGASDGWATPQFLTPLLLAFILFPFFFIWESHLPVEYALIPPSTWLIPNFTVLIVFALYIYSWYSVNFLPFIETFVRVHGDTPIIAAVRCLPQGLTAGITTIFLAKYPHLVSRPRWSITVGMVAGMGAFILFIFSDGGQGDNYWTFVFTGSIIGSAGLMTLITATNVGVMTSVPPEMAGVAGAVLQVALQVGSSVALSIQAGLLTTQPGNVENWVNVRTSFIFVIGWGVVWLMGFLIFFKPGKKYTAGKEVEVREDAEDK